MVSPRLDVPPGLLESLLDGPVLCPERIAAGRRRAACGGPDAERLADALVAECSTRLRPLQRS